MNFKNKTLWMGNIETWMTRNYLNAILNSINIFPLKITLKTCQNKRGCAFLEFLSHEKAEEILNSFNGKKINNLELRFNWLKTLEEKLSIPQIKKFTVNN
jgi:RNA recognition motif-containing protein